MAVVEGIESPRVGTAAAFLSDVLGVAVFVYRDRAHDGREADGHPTRACLGGKAFRLWGLISGAVTLVAAGVLVAVAVGSQGHTHLPGAWRAQSTGSGRLCAPGPVAVGLSRPHPAGAPPRRSSFAAVTALR